MPALALLCERRTAVVDGRARGHRATMSSMRLRQRAHLRIASHVLDPGQISEIIGVDPHETNSVGPFAGPASGASVPPVAAQIRTR
jgi:hypothetical protein